MSNLDSNSIAVVCAADDGYAMPLAVTMRSVIENFQGNRKIGLFIIDGGIKEHNKSKILSSLNPDKCHVEWIPQPDRLLGKIEVLRPFTIDGVSAENAYVNIATYYRLLIAELLPRHLRKVIYLDSDLTVIGDIEQLWNIEIGENYLLAVQEIMCPYVSSPAGLINYRELGLSPDCKYFTPGVLVVNLEKWRTDSISAKCVEYLQQNREYIRWHDADVLNAVLAGQWGELDPRWNQLATVYKFSSWKDTPFSESVYHNMVDNPYIIHFSTSAKPWNSQVQHPANHLFFQYLDMTAWSGWRLTLGKRIQRRLVRKIKQFKNLVGLPKAV
jgi:lipopolysaccharide biosynthesis glycosyltransferase